MDDTFRPGQARGPAGPDPSRPQPSTNDTTRRQHPVTGQPASTTQPSGEQLAAPAAGQPPLPHAFSGTPRPASAVVKVHPGQMLATRYRLDRPLPGRGTTPSWQAFDQTLSRSVVVHLLSPQDPGTPAVLAAARRASIATDSRFLRVLDALDPGTAEPFGFVVREFVDGESLQEVLSLAPLSGIEAAWVTREVADALAPMHAQGLFHRRLTPRSVLISVNGNVKIAGLLLDAALNPLPDEDALSWTEQEAIDVRAMGKLLYASLVARWPVDADFPQTWAWGLPAAPRTGQHWVNPGAIRVGVPPMLDAICMAIIDPQPGAGQLRTAADLGTALGRVLGNAEATGDLETRVVSYRQAARTPADGARPPTSVPVAPGTWVADSDAPVTRLLPGFGAPDEGGGEAPDADQPDDGAGRRPDWTDSTIYRRLRWLIPVVVGAVLIFALIGAIRSFVPRLNTPAAPHPVPTASISSSPAAAPGPVHIADVKEFDPVADGGEQGENPKQVPLATDGDPNTAWHTQDYFGSPKMANLKPGTGLLLDLGQATDVRSVALTLVGEPTAVQLMAPTDLNATDPPMDTVKHWQVLASNEAAGPQTTLSLPQPVHTRYVMVYLTSLPKVGDNTYRGGVAEIVVNG